MKPVVCSVVIAIIIACFHSDNNSLAATSLEPSITNSTAAPVILTTLNDTTDNDTTTLAPKCTSTGPTQERTTLTSVFTSHYSTVSEVTSSSTTSNETTATTVSTATTSQPHPSSTPCIPQSGFDAASFVGGIVLGLGVMVILVILVKCYQHHARKTELHYSQF